MLYMCMASRVVWGNGVMVVGLRFNRRVSAIVAALVALAIVLVGCGARIDTVLTVSAQGAGERVMTLTLPADEADELIGGTAAAEASIRAALPEQLAFSGIRAEPDGSLAATFTLAFASPAEYIDKAEALLELGGGAVVSPNFAVSDSLLRQGMEIRESYTSASLLTWLFVALADDGVVRGSAGISDMYELGSTGVAYEGQDLPQTSGSIRAEVLEDSGFSSVSMATDLTDLANIRRVVTYLPGANVDPQKYERFFATVVPDEATLTESGEGWRLEFAGTADQVADATNQVLASDETFLLANVEESASAPASLTLSIEQFASCANVCAADAPALTDTFTLAPAFSSAPLEVDAAAGEPVSIEYVPAILSVAQSIDFGIFDNVTSVAEFSVSETDAELVGDGFERLLAPPEGAGSLERESGEGVVTYVVTVEALVEDFSAVYTSWAPLGGLNVQDAPGANVLGGAKFYSFEPGLNSVVATHRILDAAPTTVTTPFGVWVSRGATESTQPSGSLAFETQGLTIAGLVAALTGLLVLAVGAFLIVRHRRRLVTIGKAARSGAAARLAEATLDKEFSFEARAAIATPSLMDVASAHHALHPIRSLSSSSFPTRPRPTASVDLSSISPTPSFRTKASLFDVRSQTGK